MIPVQLTLRNFLSYGEDTVTLDFSGFRVACLSGDNGHGKSALLDGLTWALWGEGRKGRSERKPDEGLLRLGATEMEVSLTFDLDNDRYHVMRRFIKRNKRSATELDLQVFDPQTKRLRPLTDSTSSNNTQRQIDSLLCMDYTTFVNSAFILQGRDAEFTQKTPRERKQVLGEILGLSRYDRLQQLAREKLNLRGTEAKHCNRRIEELDSELCHMNDHQAALQLISEQLRHQDDTIEMDTRDEKANGLALLKVKAQLEEVGRLVIERPQLQQRLLQLSSERDGLLERQRENHHLLHVATTIETDFETYQTLKSEETQLAVKSQQRWQLSQTQTQLESNIRDIRHLHERELERFSAQKTAFVQQLAQSDHLMAQESRIDQDYAQMCAYQKEEGRLKTAQQKVIELNIEANRLTLQIDTFQKGLETERDMVQGRLGDLKLLLDEQPAIEKKLADTAQELEALQIKTKALGVMREEGAALTAEIDRDGQSLEATREQLVSMVENSDTLSDSGDAECPLCGSALDQAHRAQLGVEMRQRQAECETQIAQFTLSIEAKAAERSARRTKYQELEQDAGRILPMQAEVALLRVRFEQLTSMRAEVGQLAAHDGELHRKLVTQEFAESERRQLVALQEQMANQDFSIEELQRVLNGLRSLNGADAERRLLEEARTSKHRIAMELGRADREVRQTEEILREESFAGDERRQLTEVMRAFSKLAYDAARHESIRSHLSDLAQVVLLSERLGNARRSEEEVKAKLGSVQIEIDALENRLKSIEGTLADSRELQEALAELEAHIQEIRGRLEAQRTERDQLLARKGALEAMVERCGKLSALKDEFKAKLAKAEREHWIYNRLDEAFGKDGIQALIIEGAIPEIEQETNAILRRLTDNRIQISLESLKDLKSGATRETLDIKIADELGERSYSLYSGGEAFRTNFALRVALSKVLARRAGTRLRTLIIDEGFGTQDSKGLESMIEAIQEISRDFDKILVVTHLPMLRDAFPTQIQVTKDPQYGSTLQLIHSTGHQLD